MQPFSCPVHVATIILAFTFGSRGDARSEIRLAAQWYRRTYLPEFRRIIVLSALAAGLSSTSTLASANMWPDAPRAAGPEGVVLAQSGDVEIFYDEFGRRVIVDAYTGEVLSVERPRRLRERREELRQARRDRRQERYYLDDPEDMERLRRERLREQGILTAPPIEEYDDYSGRGLPRGLDNTFPEAPRRIYREEPEIIAREPIERAPLVERAPLAEPNAPAEEYRRLKPNTPPTTEIIEEQAEPPTSFGAREEVAALQVLLDRRGASPGVIDGRFGSNVDKAIIAYRAITRENLKSTDSAGIKKALAESGGDPFTTYTITPQDAAGPYVASVPSDYGEKAKLERLSFTSVPEALAERFHMDEDYLKALNPGANFNRPGTIIRVANIGTPAKREVARIVADKGKKQVFAYDADNKLIVAYPATIGSTDTPSPTGTHAVTRIAVDPNYTYNPNLNFKQGENNKILTIPPGPNGPVGSIWIALDKPTYGIHGTPDPAKIGKTESHGCVRLTNWDAQELAKIVKPGVNVEFIN
ncbi:MAG: L,D-transpeptidase [Alphaproteobacteria bacterium]|nr:L,D-transpeptidase [Alphaproteobacteria bacterium]